MKLSNKLWQFLIVGSVVIMALNFYKIKEKKPFLFDRIFNSNLVIKSDGKDVSKIGNRHIVNATNNIVVEDSSSRATDSDTVKSHRLYYHNIFDSNYQFKEQILLPVSSSIEFCTEKRMLIINKLNMLIFNIKSKIYKPIAIAGFKVIKVFGLDDSLSNIICLGELKKENDYITGFFVLNSDSNKIGAQSKILEINKRSKAIENILIYDGNFSTNDKEIISYYCNKYSKLYFFDYSGTLSNEITTKDNTPLPSLVQNELGYYYKRGNTFSTNNGVIIRDNKVLVFSSRTENGKEIMIDVYSLKTKAYLYSKEISYKNKNCAEINFIRCYGNKAYIKFSDNESYNFTFSLNE